MILCIYIWLYIYIRWIIMMSLCCFCGPLPLWNTLTPPLMFESAAPAAGLQQGCQPGVIGRARLILFHKNSNHAVWRVCNEGNFQWRMHILSITMFPYQPMAEAATQDVELGIFNQPSPIEINVPWSANGLKHLPHLHNQWCFCMFMTVFGANNLFLLLLHILCLLRRWLDAWEGQTRPWPG